MFYFLSMNFLLLVPHISGITYLSFCVWLSIMFSGFIHAVACIRIKFLFMMANYSIVYIYHILFTHSVPLGFEEFIVESKPVLAYYFADLCLICSLNLKPSIPIHFVFCFCLAHMCLFHLYPIVYSGAGT